MLTSIQALIQPVPLPEDLARHTRRLAVGEEIDVGELLRWLVENGFHNTSAVELPGAFPVGLLLGRPQGLDVYWAKE